MKRILPFILLLALLGGCSENMPEIPCLSCADGPITTPPDSVVKKVLIEEFTGVRCVQCPAGSVEIENLLDVYGKRLVAVSIHAGFFSNPFTNSVQDLGVDQGEALNNFLDFPQGYPTAVIDRKLFSGEDDLQLDRNSWGGYIAQELEVEPEVSLKVELTYDSGTRGLSINTDILPLVDQTGEIRISVMLIESDIEDVQLTPDGEIEDYIHRHVLRDMLTPFDGETITEPFTTGTTIKKTFSHTLPDVWVETNVEALVFIHKNGTERDVLQVEVAHLPE